MTSNTSAWKIKWVDENEANDVWTIYALCVIHIEDWRPMLQFMFMCAESNNVCTVTVNLLKFSLMENRHTRPNGWSCWEDDTSWRSRSDDKYLFMRGWQWCTWLHNIRLQSNTPTESSYLVGWYIMMEDDAIEVQGHGLKIKANGDLEW